MKHKEDYQTRYFDQMVWLAMSGIESTGSTLMGDEVYLHFPDKEECERLTGGDDFKRYSQTVHDTKAIITRVKEAYS